jgi:acyl-CoA reductase-like NAD-dependent aldehyde dehydrogenase
MRRLSLLSLHSGRYRSFSSFKDSYGLWINGKEVFPPNAPTFAVNSPCTGDYITKVVSATSSDVNNAANIAQKVFESGIWSKADVRERAKILNNIAANLRMEIPRLAELEVAQTGRSIREMKAQLARLPEWFEYFGALIRTHEGKLHQ